MTGQALLIGGPGDGRLIERPPRPTVVTPGPPETDREPHRTTEYHRQTFSYLSPSTGSGRRFVVWCTDDGYRQLEEAANEYAQYGLRFQLAELLWRVRRAERTTWQPKRREALRYVACHGRPRVRLRAERLLGRP